LDLFGVDKAKVLLDAVKAAIHALQLMRVFIYGNDKHRNAGTVLGSSGDTARHPLLLKFINEEFPFQFKGWAGFRVLRGNASPRSLSAAVKASLKTDSVA
jgi:hypothetical protein